MAVLNALSRLTPSKFTAAKTAGKLFYRGEFHLALLLKLWPWFKLMKSVSEFLLLILYMRAAEAKFEADEDEF